MRTVRRGRAGSGMKSLTWTCQANRIRVGVRTIRMDTTGPTSNHSLPMKQTNPSGSKNSEQRHSWTSTSP